MKLSIDGLAKWGLAIIGALVLAFVLWCLFSCAPRIGGGGLADGNTFPAGESPDTEGQNDLAGGIERESAGLGSGDSGAGGDTGDHSQDLDSGGGSGVAGGGDSGPAGSDSGLGDGVAPPDGDSGNDMGRDPAAAVVAQTAITVGTVITGVVCYFLGIITFGVLDFIADKRAARRRRNGCNHELKGK